MSFLPESYDIAHQVDVIYECVAKYRSLIYSAFSYTGLNANHEYHFVQWGCSFFEDIT